MFVCKFFSELNWAAVGFNLHEEVMWSGNVSFSFCILRWSVNPLPCACVYVTGRRNLNDGALQNRLDYLNNVATLMVFATTILNFFISTFAMQSTGYFPWLMMRIHWRFCGPLTTLIQFWLWQETVFLVLPFFATELPCFCLVTLSLRLIFWIVIIVEWPRAPPIGSSFKSRS